MLTVLITKKAKGHKEAFGGNGCGYCDFGIIGICPNLSSHVTLNICSFFVCQLYVNKVVLKKKKNLRNFPGGSVVIQGT